MAQDEQRHTESNALDDWLEKAGQVKRSLRAFELASQEKHGNSHVEIQLAIKEQEVSVVSDGRIITGKCYPTAFVIPSRSHNGE